MLPTKAFLEKTYREMNRPEFIHPDPLEFVWRYKSAADREVVGLIAACLAYGNVTQILKSVEKVLAPMGKTPAAWLKTTPPAEIKKNLARYKHRFTTGEEMAVFLLNIKRALEKYGSLEKLFLAGYDKAEPTVEEALYRFINAFNTQACAPTLTPCPEHKSSFKRVNLFLRWMVRKDAVDPGVWTGVSPSKLIIPLDTHMRQVSMGMGITKRKDTSMKTAVEITAFFGRLAPEDPVRYDFALTRAGIRGNNT
ncbi:MAG TPA: TIGR02757 family protein [Elusimicrobia bacterium]|nr:MAG: TIGR02757 family protein [Elusimicrobia bacterium GWD2_63_28]HCC46933.1 TIGR02757 family protein [Elusimicrobiota bacterium]